MTEGTPAAAGSPWPQREQPGRPRTPGRRRLVLVLVLAWGLVVAALAVRAVGGSRPTAPEQTPIAEVLPQADGVVADLVAAIDPTRTAVVLDGYRQISGACRITAARSGERYERALTAYPGQGGESQLLAEMAGRLPQRYEPHLAAHRETPVLTAMDLTYIAVRATATEPGVVRVTVDTGCRPGTARGAASLAGTTVDRAPAAPVAAVRSALGALGLRAQQWSVATTRCTGAGQLWTVAAVAPTTGAALQPAPGTAPSEPGGVPSGAGGTPSGAPGTGATWPGEVGREPGATTLLELPDVLAYRSGDVATVIRRGDTAATVAAATACVP